MRVALVLLLLAACERPSAEQPSWLVVELVPAPGVQPLNVEVYIAPADRAAFPVCVGVAGDPGTTTASLLLERSRDADATAPVGLIVTAHGELNGQAGTGKDFTCPGTFPPPLAPPQDLEVRFCAGETRRVVFHVGARCGCGTGAGGGGGAGGSGGAPGACCEATQLCGAGVSSTGLICGDSECCDRSIVDACIELDQP